MSIRLNPNLLPDLLLSIQQSSQNQDIATQQLASGKAVNQLSDNPAAASALVTNHDHTTQDDQFLQNITTLQSRFQTADSTLSNVVTVLTNAISLGTEGANGTMSASDQAAIASEVQGLQTQLVGLANTSFQGTYLFAGTAVNTQPFTLDQSTGAVTYNGNTGVTSTQLYTGDSINTNVPGSQLFQNASGDAFAALQNLTSSLTSNTNIGAAVTQVQNALSQVSVQRVFYGNALNQVSTAENFLNQDKLDLSSQENTLVGADLAAVASNLAQAQTANQATIAATGRILSEPNLLDYITTTN